LGIGDWGLGIGDWAQSPIPNPQSPIPNPQFNDDYLNKILFKKIFNDNFFLFFINNFNNYNKSKINNKNILNYLK